jgi:hypothetical protein
MRWVWLVLLGCSSAPACGPSAARPTREPAAAVEESSASDPDRDHIAGACDLCPNEPETYNGILDEDGCPESSSTSHAVIEHPTNRFAYPAAVSFQGLKMTNEVETDDLDETVEVIDVIGRSGPGVSPALAAKRAAIVGKALRGRLSKIVPGVRIDEHVTAASNLYIDEGGATDLPASVNVQVMRASGVEIWRWERDHLVRATPRRRLPAPKLPPGC